ncbi:MAG TPA: HEAT repeat domain-containing protein [Planctomycetota bacterium]|nr:HEAT repeat domain-containing protein [Planctomycetota bacterium]
MAYVPPPPGSTELGKPTPEGVQKQDVHIADLPPEVRRSFLLSMVFFPSLVGAMICAVVFLGWWTVFDSKKPEQYAKELSSPDARRRWMAAREMAENIGDKKIYHSETLTSLIGILQNPELDKETELWSPTSMIKQEGEKASRLRWWAAAMVGHFAAMLPDPADKKRGLEALIKALDDKEVAVFAARGLSLLKDPAARDALVDKLQNSPDPAIRAAAANALGAIGGYLVVMKKSDDELKPFREPLRKAFETEKEKEVSDNAAIALARLKDPFGQARLNELAKSEDAVIRDHAQRALNLLSGKEAEVSTQPGLETKKSSL